MTQLNAGNMDSFHASPDYQWSLAQGVNALDRSAAAHGSLYSGGHSTDLMNYGAGLAAQNYGNYYNRLASLAAMGQSSANALSGVNQNYADNVSGIQSTAANQRDSILNSFMALTRIAGSGAVSDKDIDVIRNQLPRLENYSDANYKTLEQLRATMQDYKQRMSHQGASSQNTLGQSVPVTSPSRNLTDEEILKLYGH